MNSELRKWAVMITGAALAAWYVKRQTGAAVDRLTGALSDMVDSVVSAAGAAVDTVWKAENAVSADAGTKEAYRDWSSTRNITPLIYYFQQYGNTTATRNSARASGWTDGEISMAVATVGSMAGYY